MFIFLFRASPIPAETIKITVACRVSNSEQFYIGDGKDHFLGVISRTGLALFESGDMAGYESWETYERDHENIICNGYAQFRYMDGITNMIRYQGKGKAIRKDEVWVYEGECEYVGGTGPYEGLCGKGHYNGKKLTPFSPATGTRGDTYYHFILVRELPCKKIH